MESGAGDGNRTHLSALEGPHNSRYTTPAYKCHPETLETLLTLPIQTHYDGKFCLKEATPLNFPHLLYGQVGNLPYADTIDDFLPFQQRSFLATPTRLERATSCVTGKRSNQLNYGAI